LQTHISSVVYCYFFFQAEDGIRDGHVTGVQTCALPISYIFRGSCFARRATLRIPRIAKSGSIAGPTETRSPSCLVAVAINESPRSEERRVGKECGCGGWGGHCAESGRGVGEVVVSVSGA